MQVGDKVQIVNLPHDRITDYQADLLANLEEGDITGARFDRISKVFDQLLNEGKSPVLEVWLVDKDGNCELKYGKTKLCFLFDSKELTLVAN